MAGWTTNLLEGLGELLDAAGAGIWRPTGMYAAGETGILLRAVPPEPARIISLAVYPVTDDPGLLNVTVGIQVRTRGGADPRDVDDIADAVYDALHSAEHLVLGGVVVNQIYRKSFTSLGTDPAGRWERSDNYYCDAARPVPDARQN